MRTLLRLCASTQLCNLEFDLPEKYYFQMAAGGEKTFKHPRLLGTDMYCPVLDITTLYNWSQPAKPTLVLTSSSDYDNVETVLSQIYLVVGRKKSRVTLMVFYKYEHPTLCWHL